MLSERNRVRCLFICAVFISASLSFSQGLFGPIQAGDTAAFNSVLQAGADFNAADEYGQTPLMYAVTFNQPDMVEALIAAGADVNARTLAGWTALHYAARDSTDARTVETLLTAGADPTARNDSGDSPHDVAVDGDNQIARHVLENTRLPTTQVHGLLTPPTATLVQNIATKGMHSLALLQDGTVMAWGSNFGGALGDGTTTDPRTPTPVLGLTNVEAISAGETHSLALLQDGTVMAWGANGSGQLGDGTTTERHTPILVSRLTNVQAIAAGPSHSFALLQDGTVAAWGDNRVGQLGDGTTDNQSTPVPVQGLANVRAIAAGFTHFLALLQDGTVVEWRSTYRNTQTTPVQVQGLANVQAIAAANLHSLALLQDGTVMAWGSNMQGELGDSTPVPVQGLANVRAIAAGFEHSLALLQDGTVMAWGANGIGQLGDGTTDHQRTPVPVQGLANVQAIAAASFHSLALLQDGTVVTWGSNRYGELGDGTITINPRGSYKLTVDIGTALRDAEARAVEQREAAERAAVARRIQAEQEEAERRARAETSPTAGADRRIDRFARAFVSHLHFNNFLADCSGWARGTRNPDFLREIPYPAACVVNERGLMWAQMDWESLERIYTNLRWVTPWTGNERTAVMRVMHKTDAPEVLVNVFIMPYGELDPVTMVQYALVYVVDMTP